MDERAHGLPPGRRQLAVPTPGGMSAVVRRDVDYDPFRLVVEVDSLLFHDTAAQRDLDLDRDLDAVVGAVAASRTTVRLGWGQVFGRPRATAVRLGLLLQTLGWSGTVTPCTGCSRSAA